MAALPLKYRIKNRIGFIMAIPFFLLTFVLIPLTALIIYAGVSVRRWSLKQGKSSFWQFMSLIEDMSL